MIPVTTHKRFKYRQLITRFSFLGAATVCCVLINLSLCLSHASEYRPASPLSAAGLTEQQFEYKVKEYLGIPYRRGGTSKKGMDCSSFVRTVYNRFFDIDLPYSAFGQFTFSGFQNIDESQMQPGDLIFFASKTNKRINHVGMYISDGQFIHASSSQGIIVSNIDDRYWSKRFAGSKRLVLENSKPEPEMIPFFEEKLVDTHSFASEHYHDNAGFEQKFFHDHDVYFSLLGDGFDLFSPGPDFDPGTFHMDLASDDPLFEKTEETGISLPGDFSSGSGFSMIPSVTYYDYFHETDNLFNIPKWPLGKSIILEPARKKWSLSMMVQSSEGDNVLHENFLFSKFSSLDMEVKFGINLTESLQFSITGKHDSQTGSLGKIPVDSSWMDSAMSDIFMTFDVSY